MSKSHMIVLGFLHETPMYGYRIGQLVESKRCPVWEGIKIASIYKAMQILEKNGYIIGKQVTEGNNPTRTVYSINDKGIRYLTQLMSDYLSNVELPGHDYWLGLSFTRQLFTRKQMHKILNKRLQFLNNILSSELTSKIEGLIQESKLPIIHKHMARLGDGWSKVELEVLQDLIEKIDSSEYDSFFKE